MYLSDNIVGLKSQDEYLKLTLQILLQSPLLSFHVYCFFLRTYPY